MVVSISGFQRCRRFSQFALTPVLSALLFSVPPTLGAQDGFLSSTDVPDAAAGVPAKVQPEPNLNPEEIGDIQMARRGYQAALQAFLQVSPKQARVWNKIGISYQQMFMTEQAKKSYETALKMEPKNTNVMNNLGTVYYSLKLYRDSEHMYRRALKLDQKSALIQKNLGTTLLAENKLKQGWESYQQAMVIDPDIFERSTQLRIGEPTSVQRRGAINYYLAKSYVRVGKLDRAVDCLRMAIDQGFTDRKKVLADKEFASLHGFSAFEQLIAEQSMR